jgi:hypothetical protein
MARQPRRGGGAGVASQPPNSLRRTAAGRAPATHGQSRRRTQEQRYQRLTLLIGAAVVLVVALLLGAGWYESYILPYRQTVITVGSLHASMQYYIDRMKQLAPEFSQADPTTVLATLPDATRQAIEDDYIVLQKASEEGATVTDAQVDTQMATQLGVDNAPGANYASNRGSLEAALTARLGSAGLTLAQLRQQMKAQLLSTSVQAKLAADYPKVGPEAKYEVLITPTQDAAQKLVDRLNSGTDWETLVAEIHNNPSEGTVSQFDFQPQLQIDPKLAGPLFQLQPNGHTGVIATSDGKYTIARLIEKDDQHQITDDQIRTITPKLYENWIDDMKKTLTVKDSMSDTQRAFAVARSGYQPQAQGQGAPGQPQGAPPQPQQAPAQAPPQYNPANLPPGFSTPTGGFGSGAQPAAPGTQGP